MTGLAATSVAYLEDLYTRYQHDPGSVEQSWRYVFDLARELSDGEGGTAASASLLAEIVRQRGHLVARIDPRTARSSQTSMLS